MFIYIVRLAGFYIKKIVIWVLQYFVRGVYNENIIILLLKI